MKADMVFNQKQEAFLDGMKHRNHANTPRLRREMQLQTRIISDTPLRRLAPPTGVMIGTGGRLSAETPPATARRAPPLVYTGNQNQLNLDLGFVAPVTLRRGETKSDMHLWSAKQIRETLKGASSAFHKIFMLRELLAGKLRSEVEVKRFKLEHTSCSFFLSFLTALFCLSYFLSLLII